jgi:adenylate cyclase class IV
MYETEIKIEITGAQLRQLIKSCQTRGFLDKGVVPQADYYTQAVKSQHGDPQAFDIERYRSEAGKFIYTRKVWEALKGSDPIRREGEHEITEQEFQIAVAAHPQALKIVKDRHRFDASFGGREISLSVDSVKFDHSPEVRHFVEPEILVADKAKVPETREFLRRFIAGLLGMGVDQIEEAPGMFAMAFKKL